MWSWISPLWRPLLFPWLCHILLVSFHAARNGKRTTNTVWPSLWGEEVLHAGDVYAAFLDHSLRMLHPPLAYIHFCFPSPQAPWTARWLGRDDRTSLRMDDPYALQLRLPFPFTQVLHAYYLQGINLVNKKIIIFFSLPAHMENVVKIFLCIRLTFYNTVVKSNFLFRKGFCRVSWRQQW